MHESSRNIEKVPPPVAQEAAAQSEAGTNVRLSVHYTHSPLFVKHFPSELNALAQRARDAGDYAGYWDYRRRFLLAQAAAYVQEVR